MNEFSNNHPFQLATYEKEKIVDLLNGNHSPLPFGEGLGVRFSL